MMVTGGVAWTQNSYSGEAKATLSKYSEKQKNIKTNGFVILKKLCILVQWKLFGSATKILVHS